MPVIDSRLPRRSRPVGRALTIAVLTASALGLTGCGAGGGSSDASVLNVGQLGATKVNEALLHASGQDKGMKYKVNWSLYPAGGPAFLEAVPSGSVDFASMADTPPIFGQVAGQKTKIVAVSTSTPPDESIVDILVAKDSPIHSMADLKGKKVAILQATILQYTVVRALEKAGLKYSDIKPVNLAPPDAATAFQKGQVDAVAALDPQLAQLRAAGARVIGDGVGITAGYTVDVASQTALDNKAKRADIEDFAVRLAKAQIWGQTHLDQWLPVYAKVTGLPEDISRAILQRQQVKYLPIDDAVIAKQQEQADAYTQLGLLKKIDVSSEFDDSFNDTMVKAGS